ncbi:STAS domain-containing protein [Streptomyces ziwulingensis]|uniref:Anti-sigma factor antagonist n=1 Tax=Streptomyces ziwulingensis TaxID=1045501 RepID=A0ABP9BLT0_9ACTN
MPGNTAPAAPHIRTYETAGKTVVELLGEIDIAAVDHVGAELDTATDRPELRLVIDLGSVDFMDCVGLGMLCRARRRVEDRGGHLTLVCPHPLIRKMLRVAGLWQVFTLTDTLDEALGSREAAT